MRGLATGKRELEYGIPGLHFPVNSRCFLRFSKIPVRTKQYNIPAAIRRNRFLPFAPVDFRRRPEPVPRTQVLSWPGIGRGGDASLPEIPAGGDPLFKPESPNKLSMCCFGSLCICQGCLSEEVHTFLELIVLERYRMTQSSTCFVALIVWLEEGTYIYIEREMYNIHIDI